MRVRACELRINKYLHLEKIREIIFTIGHVVVQESEVDRVVLEAVHSQDVDQADNVDDHQRQRSHDGMRHAKGI